MNLSATAWKIMNDNDYKSVVNDKKTLWGMFSAAMKKAWSNFKKAVSVIMLSSVRALKPIERGRIQYQYGVYVSKVSVDLQAGFLIFGDVLEMKKLLESACCNISGLDLNNYKCDGKYWLDEHEFDGVAEILDELRDLPINSQ